MRGEEPVVAMQPENMKKMAAASAVRIVKELKSLKDELEVLEAEEERLVGARRVEAELREQKRMDLQKEEEERRIKESIELRNETEKLRKQRLQRLRDEQRQEDAARTQRERQYQQLQWDLVSAKTGKGLEKTIRKRKELDEKRAAGQDIIPEAVRSRADVVNILDGMRRDLVDLNASDWHKKQLIAKRQAAEALKQKEVAQAKAGREPSRDLADTAPYVADIRSDLLALSDELLMLEREEMVERFRARAKQEHWDEQKVLLDRHKQDMAVKNQRQLEQDQVEEQLEAEQSQQSIADMEFVLAKQIGQLHVLQNADGKRQYELEQLKQTLTAVQRLPKSLIRMIDEVDTTVMSPATVPPATPPQQVRQGAADGEPATEPHPTQQAPPTGNDAGLTDDASRTGVTTPPTAAAAPTTPQTTAGAPAASPSHTPAWGETKRPQSAAEVVELLQYDATRDQTAAYLAQWQRDACGTLSLEEALTFSKNISEENEAAVAQLIVETQARLEILKEEQRRHSQRSRSPSPRPGMVVADVQPSSMELPAATADEQSALPGEADHANANATSTARQEARSIAREDVYRSNMQDAAAERTRVVSEVARLRDKLAVLQEEEAASQRETERVRGIDIRQEIELQEFRMLDYNADARYIRQDTAMLKQACRAIGREARAFADQQRTRRQIEMDRAARVIHGFYLIVMAKKRVRRMKHARRANLSGRELAGAVLATQQAYRQKQARKAVAARRREIADSREARAREMYEEMKAREAAADPTFTLTFGCITLRLNPVVDVAHYGAGGDGGLHLTLNLTAHTEAPGVPSHPASRTASPPVSPRRRAPATASAAVQTSRPASGATSARSGLGSMPHTPGRPTSREEQRVGTPLGVVRSLRESDAREAAAAAAAGGATPARTTPREIRDIPRRTLDAELAEAEARNEKRRMELAAEASAENAEQNRKTSATDGVIVDQQVANNAVSSEAAAILDAVAQRQADLEANPVPPQEPITGEAERLEYLEQRIEVLSRQISEEREGHLARERERAATIETAKAQVIAALTSQKDEQARQIEELTELLEEHAELITALRRQLTEATRYGPYEEDWIRGEAALRIQKTWRGKASRANAAQRRAETAAANTYAEQDEAAAVIQGAFRRRRSTSPSP